jgi:hypothetical protein
MRGFSLARRFLGDVEGVQAAGVAHGRAQGQRLAAGAGAEVHHHLAAAGADDLGQHLAALVLHFDRAFLEQRQVLQRRLLQHAQAQRRVRHRLGGDRRLGQLGHHVVAVGLDRVDAQVQRRRGVQHGGQRHGFFLAELGDQLVVQPGRQVGLHLWRQQAAVDFLDAGEELVFRLRSRRRGHSMPTVSDRPSRASLRIDGMLPAPAKSVKKDLLRRTAYTASAMTPRSRPPKRGWSLK